MEPHSHLDFAAHLAASQECHRQGKPLSSLSPQSPGLWDCTGVR